MMRSVHCTNCGAPLPPVEDQRQVRCQYCGNVQVLAPPRVEPTPPRAPRAKGSSGPGCSIAAGIAISLIVGLGAAGSALFGSLRGAALSEVKKGLGVEVAFPATCGLNDELVIDGRNFEGQGTLISADTHCKIKIKNSTLKGDVVVAGKNLLELTVENSRLEGKTLAVDLGMNGKLSASKNSSFKGEEAALQSGINGEVTLSDSSVEGNESGIKGETNFKLHATNSRIVGKDYGLSAKINLEVDGKELTLTGERAAIVGDVNMTLDLRGGSARGGEAAILSKDGNLKLKLSRGARVGAREIAVKVMSSNVELEMQEAEIDGVERGIETGVNPKFELNDKSRVHGGRIAIKVDSNLELRLRGAKIESEGTALCAGYNAQIQARSSSFRGEDAFRFRAPPKEFELFETSVIGNKLVNVSGCASQAPPSRGAK